MQTLPPVIVLGQGLTALGVMRTCRRAGLSVYSLGPSTDIDRHSRWHRPAPMRAGAAQLVNPTLAETLAHCALPTAVLMPCSDALADEVAGLDGELRMRFPASLPTRETVSALTDKATFGRMLKETGIPHPFTRELEVADALSDVPESVLSSAFLKPHDSQRFFARFGVKGFWITSVSEATERMRMIEEVGLKVLLQEYVPGPTSEHHLVDGFIDAQGRCRGVFTRRRLRMYPADFGNSSYMISVPREAMSQAIASVQRLLARLNYRGIFSAEFKRDPRDGLFKILEVNARPWWYIEFAARCGVDVCTMAYRDALGLPVAEVDGQRDGVRLVYPYYDYFACGDAVKAGRMTRREWWRSWIGAQQPLFNWSDPMPAVAEFVSVVNGWVRSRIRGRRA